MMDQDQTNLVKKLSESRDKLEDYVKELEGLKKTVDGLFPKTEGVQNYRSKWILEEKLKESTGFFDSLLRLRTEINKTIKDEIEIRRKLDDKTAGATAEDIFEIADSIAKLKQKEDTEEKEPEQILNN